MTADPVPAPLANAAAARVRVPVALHARPAARLVRLLQNFAAEVQLVKNDARADAQSLLDVLSLSIGEGDWIEIYASGVDKLAAQEAVAHFFTTGFGE